MDDELLAVAANDAERLGVQLEVDEVQELLHVPQQFLADALARAVDAEFHPRRAVEDGGGEQADGDGLSNCRKRVSCEQSIIKLLFFLHRLGVEIRISCDRLAHPLSCNSFWWSLWKVPGDSVL